MKVRVITGADRAHYERDMGEPWFCGYSNPANGDPTDCGGFAEIEIETLPCWGRSERQTFALCRKCGADVAELLQSAVSTVDGADLAGWTDKA